MLVRVSLRLVLYSTRSGECPAKELRRFIECKFIEDITDILTIVKSLNVLRPSAYITAEFQPYS
jgi:hypothetical protein